MFYLSLESFGVFFLFPIFIVLILQHYLNIETHTKYVSQKNILAWMQKG